MSRPIAAAIAGVSLAVAVIAATVWFAERKTPLFARDQPVSEAQLAQRLLARGYADIRIEHEGFYLKATVTKDRKEEMIAVDTRNGEIANPWVEDND